MKFVNRIQQVVKYSPIFLSRPSVYPAIAAGFLKTLVLKKAVLRYLELQVNVDCNAQCIMCYANKMKQPGQEILSLREIREIYVQLKKRGLVSGLITGGEPTLRSDLIDIFDALEARRNIYAMTTNSLLLTKQMVAELKKVGLVQLNLSLNSMDPKINDYERAFAGHFDKVMQVTSWAQAAGIFVGFSVVVSHQNVGGLERFLVFCKEKGVQFNPAWAVSQGRWAGKDDVRLTDEDWEFLHAINNKYPHMRMDIATNYNCHVDCPGATEKLYVTAYGEVSTCQLNPVSFGSLRTESLDEILDRLRKISCFNKIQPRCILSSDLEYIKTYIEPIMHYPKSPVDFREHPVVKGEIR